MCSKKLAFPVVGKLCVLPKNDTQHIGVKTRSQIRFKGGGGLLLDGEPGDLSLRYFVFSYPVRSGMIE